MQERERAVLETGWSCRTVDSPEKNWSSVGSNRLAVKVYGLGQGKKSDRKAMWFW